MFKKRNLFILLGMIIILISVMVFVYMQNKPKIPPRMLISETEWDYGMVKPNDSPIHIFTVKNEGDEELIIEKVRVSCGCVQASISTKNIKPGKSAELKATFNTAGYEGKVNKDFYIKSNDPLEPEKRISLHIDIQHQPKPIISFSETEWNLGLISQGDTPTFPFIIENKGDTDLIITKVDTYAHIKHNITVPLRIFPTEIYEGVLIYDSNEHELGEVREAVRIYNNDPNREGVSLRISGYVKEEFASAVSISPIELDFNLANSSEDDNVETISLQNSANKEIKVISIKSSVDYFIPLNSELKLDSGEKKELQVIILKDKAMEEMKEEKTEEYIYLTIALPVKISK